MTGIRVCLVCIILTAAYIASTVLVSNLLFYNASNGSLIKLNDNIVGSKLIGQQFKSNIYFHGRPSAYNYINDISGNSNLPYYSEKLKGKISKNYNHFFKTNSGSKPDLNLIVESASGLDPHITYIGALSQVNRIASNSTINKAKLIQIIKEKSRPRIIGLFGEKIITVLELNLELEKLYATKTRSR